MSCPKNIQRFWIFKWEGPCKPVPEGFKKDWDGGKVKVWRRCTQCGCDLPMVEIEQRELVRMGYSGDAIRNLPVFGDMKKPEELLPSKQEG